MTARDVGKHQGLLFWSWLWDQARQVYAWVALSGLISIPQVPSILRFVLKQVGSGGDAAEWTSTALHATQALVVLSILIALYRRRLASFKAVVHDKKSTHHEANITLHRLRHEKEAALAQDGFYQFWQYLWLSWFLLYSCLAGFSFAAQYRINKEINDPWPIVGPPVGPSDRGEAVARVESDWPRKSFFDYCNNDKRDGLSIPHYLIARADKGDASYARPPWNVENLRRVRVKDVRLVIQRLEDPEHEQPPSRFKQVHQVLVGLRRLLHYSDWAENTLNNLQTLTLFLAYFSLVHGAAPRGAASPSPKAHGLTTVAVLAAAEFFMVLADVSQVWLKPFAAVSAIAGGTLMALFVSRLESRRFRGLTPVITLLLLYAVLQSGWALERNANEPEYVSILLYFTYLVLKLLLFGYVTWILQSGIMLYYFHTDIKDATAEGRGQSDFFKHIQQAFVVPAKHPDDRPTVATQRRALTDGSRSGGSGDTA